MEPLTALGAAANVVQFVDFACKLITGSYDIYKSTDGTSKQHQGLTHITKSLKRLNQSLIQSAQAQSAGADRNGTDTDLEELLRQCSSVAEELLAALDKLKLSPEEYNRKWGSLRQYVKSIWNQTDLDALHYRLNDFRQQIPLHLLVSIREQVFKIQQEQSRLDEKLRERPSASDQTGKALLEKFFSRDQSVEWQRAVIQTIHRSYSPGVHTMQPSTAQMVADIEPQTKEDLINSLLRMLQFQEIKDRRQRIPEAHKRTFEWIFGELPDGAQENSDFMEWLRNDERLYWVTGKAGSGKSTLMKFIYDHRKTRGLYANPDSSQVVLAAYFFWNSGTRLQMSREGLLRTLLHECLTQCQHLVPNVLPQRWEAFRLFGYDYNEWTWLELSRAFNTLLDITVSSHRYLFIIDGLDEFDGDHALLIPLVQDLVAKPHVKTCVASRPWVVFEDAFRQFPNLLMQDLTHADLQRYVSDHLNQNQGFSILRNAEPHYAINLAVSITTKASGVFLWVVLVVHSLLTGLTSGDRISDLERRLNALPTDLEHLFWKMLHSSGPDQFERAAQIFRIIDAAPNPRLLDLAFADEDENRVFSQPVKHMPGHEREARAEMMRRRLDHVCKGLLEVERGPSLATAKVEYLHRTVKDFLEQEDIRRKIVSSTSSDFNPYAAWCRSDIMQLKISDAPLIGVFWDHIILCLRYAIKAQQTGYRPQALLYDAIDNAAQESASTKRVGGSSLIDSYATIDCPHWSSTHRYVTSSNTFLNFAVQCQLYPYIRHMLEEEGVNPNRGGTPLLYSALCAHRTNVDGTGSDLAELRQSFEVVELLLRHGADLNARTMGGASLWRQALEFAVKKRSNGLRTVQETQFNDALSYFLKGERFMPLYQDKMNGALDDFERESLPTTQPSQEDGDAPAVDWDDILHLCLRHGANPQDALEVLEGHSNYLKTLALARELHATKDSRDSASKWKRLVGGNKSGKQVFRQGFRVLCRRLYS